MIKRLLFMLMIALLAGTLVGWSTTVKVYSENGKMEEYNPRTGDRLVIPGEAQSVDLRGLDVTIVLDVSGANPNCLYYLNAQDKVPEGLDADRLIVRDNAIDELIIHQDYPFWSMNSFKAATALFVYTLRNEMMDGRQPEAGVVRTGTVVLPFDVDRVWLYDVNDAPGVEIATNSEALNICSLEGYEGDKLLFRPVDSGKLKASEPYLISMAQPSRIAFYAENVTVSNASMPALKSCDAGIHFCGATVSMYSMEACSWSYLDRCFIQRKGNIPAFSAVMYVPSGDSQQGATGKDGESDPDGKDGANGVSGGVPGTPLVNGAIRIEAIIIGAENATGISTVDGTNPQPVYTLSGQQLGTADVNTLKPGLYIIGGRKAVVK